MGPNKFTSNMRWTSLTSVSMAVMVYAVAGDLL